LETYEKYIGKNLLHRKKGERGQGTKKAVGTLVKEAQREQVTTSNNWGGAGKKESRRGEMQWPIKVCRITPKTGRAT